jgi:type IV secretion system protein VirD4
MCASNRLEWYSKPSAPDLRTIPIRHRQVEPGITCTRLHANSPRIRCGADNTQDCCVCDFLKKTGAALGKASEIVVLEDCPPILNPKIRYYLDRTFVDRLKCVSPGLGQLGRQLLTAQQLAQAIRAGELVAPVALINLAAHGEAVNNDSADRVRVPAGAGQDGMSAMRNKLMTAGDVPRMHQLALPLRRRFSAVEKLVRDELDQAALRGYADALCRHAGIRI